MNVAAKSLGQPTDGLDRTDPSPVGCELDGVREEVEDDLADAVLPMKNKAENVTIRVVQRLLESQFLRFYLVAAAISFLVAAASNYGWNRIWTFRTSGAPVLGQGARAFIVSALSLGANQLFLLALVAAGAGHLSGQAVAIVLATPFSFAANKLWAFAEPARVGELQPVAQPALTRHGRRR